MTARDIVRLTRQNLFRRKLRTLLTVLGVVIGCCSIVIMISIGIGMKVSQEKLLASMGDLTIIQVSSWSAQSKKLDRAAIKDMRSIPGVIALTPKLTLDEGNPRCMPGRIGALARRASNWLDSNLKPLKASAIRS